MKGKKYSYAKDDKGVTHAYGVLSILDNPSDNEIFESFVSKMFMRSHMLQFANAINRMSSETLDLIKNITGKYQNFLQYGRNVSDQIGESLNHSEALARDALSVSVESVRLLRSPTFKSSSEEEEEIGPDVAETTEADVDTESADDEFTFDLSTHKGSLEAVHNLSKRISTMNSMITRLESAIHKLLDSGYTQFDELTETHAEYVDRLKHKLNKEVKDDSNYLYNLYITYKSKHEEKLYRDFKKEHPTVSISGLKIRGAHKTYDAANAQASEIAKHDDYMDTFVFKFGEWISLPIRTDAAENVVYREKELQELLGTRIEETEKIKQARREGKSVSGY